MPTSVQQHGAVWIHHTDQLLLRYLCTIPPAQYRSASWSTSTFQHTGDTIKMEYCRRIKIMHSSRILLNARTCLESSLLTYQDEFGPIYILMIIMDAAVFFSLRQQPKILICCTLHSCLPSQISGETVHKPIELVSLKVTN